MKRRATTRVKEVTLTAAVERYCARFGQDALPCLCAAQGNAAPVAAALLEEAVRMNRPLRFAAVAEALGEPEPPLTGAI